MFGFTKRQNGSSAQDQQLHQLQQMLDHVDNLIMLADSTPDNTIIYMNKTARDVLAQYRSAMNQKFRPGVDVAQAHQHSIHQFHRDPDRIRGILQDLASSRLDVHKATIPVGNVIFETKVFPIWKKTRRANCCASWPAFVTSARNTGPTSWGRKLRNAIS
ncbi:PAS domain-containing protein [Vogesella urethralis]|uniref:PAS domain-containing protein n=1 Tax=Vogesella urethralis TaxID=2592656 RepID=UPI001478656C|nr:PAS domain-containing protein [Vogesella urethralis]